MSKDEVETIVAGDEPFLGTLDIALLVVLISGVAWYFLRSRKKEEEPIRSYSIQYVQKVFKNTLCIVLIDILDQQR